MGVIRGHQASHDFWGRQNFSPPRVPTTHATPLQKMQDEVTLLTSKQCNNLTVCLGSAGGQTFDWGGRGPPAPN